MSNEDMARGMHIRSVAPLNLPAAVLESRRRLAADPYRPLYHYAAPCNLLKDPNGPLYWQGRYHLFYQNNPYEVEDANMHWGHAVSEDLVHWTDLPVALCRRLADRIEMVVGAGKLSSLMVYPPRFTSVIRLGFALPAVTQRTRRSSIGRNSRATLSSHPHQRVRHGNLLTLASGNTAISGI